MLNRSISRRALLKSGGAAFAGLTMLRVAGPDHLFGQSGTEVIAWLDQPPPNPVPAIVGNLLRWESLDSRLTPANNFFTIAHHGIPDVLNDATWRVEIAGLVAH